MIEKEEFENKFSNFKKTVNTLKNAIVYAKKNENHKEFSMFKDSVIQRFEYTFELSWKFMKYILEKNDDETETRSPKQTIKSAFKIGYIDDIDKWFLISDYRNKTSHAYQEDIADDLYYKIPNFFEEIQKFYESIKIKYEQGYFRQNKKSFGEVFK